MHLGEFSFAAAHFASPSLFVRIIRFPCRFTENHSMTINSHFLSCSRQRLYAGSTSL